MYNIWYGGLRASLQSNVMKRLGGACSPHAESCHARIGWCVLACRVWVARRVPPMQILRASLQSNVARIGWCVFRPCVAGAVAHAFGTPLNFTSTKGQRI